MKRAPRRWPRRATQGATRSLPARKKIQRRGSASPPPLLEQRQSEAPSSMLHFRRTGPAAKCDRPFWSKRLGGAQFADPGAQFASAVRVNPHVNEVLRYSEIVQSSGYAQMTAAGVGAIHVAAAG